MMINETWPDEKVPWLDVPVGDGERVEVSQASSQLRTVLGDLFKNM